MNIIQRIKNSISSRFKTSLDSFVKKRDLTLVFDSFLKDSNSQIVIVGSNAGQEVPFYLRFFSRIDLIDPLIPKLRMHPSCRSKCVHLHQFAVSSRTGTRSLFIASNNGESSSLLEPTHHLMEYPAITFDKIETSAIRLNDLDFFSSSNVLILDVQGSEIDVLNSSFPYGLGHLSIIICEYSLVPLYEGSGDLSAIISFLGPLGFVLAFTISPYISGRECTADALFLKKDFLIPAHPPLCQGK